MRLVYTVACYYCVNTADGPAPPLCLWASFPGLCLCLPFLYFCKSSIYTNDDDSDDQAKCCTEHLWGTRRKGTRPSDRYILTQTSTHSNTSAPKHVDRCKAFTHAYMHAFMHASTYVCSRVPRQQGCFHCLCINEKFVKPKSRDD